jgi:streptogramin lyase
VPSAYQPCGIVDGADGNPWFTATKVESNSTFTTVGRVTPRGAITMSMTSIATCGDITVGPDGNLWFTDYQGSALWRYNLK